MPPDYSGPNLRGRSFKGQNLTGANFSQADIRGVDFTNATLKGADFTGAKAGLQRRWVIGLLIITLLLSVLSGFLSILIGVLIAYIFNEKNSENVIAGIVSLVIVIVFCVVTIRKGLIAGAGSLAVAGTLAVALAGAGAGALAVAGTLAGALAGAGAGSLAVAGTLAGAGSLAGAGTLAVAGAVAVALALARTLAVAGAGAVALALAGAGAGVFVIFSAYIGWRSLKGDERDPWIRSYAIAFAATGGTSFHGADLTDANFTGATLKNTDFRKANLTRTRFYEAKKLDFAEPGNTILSNPAVLNLLVTLNGRDKSYFGANLRGANLIDADLKEANLKNADIIEATFQGANLEWANLTLTQAIGTNFTKAQMTGACVEAWNIESTTILDNVDCRFVYLLKDPKPGTDDRERRPSSGEFQPGEFTKLFEEVLNTVDLIFQNGIDWKAFITAFKKVQVENGDTELVIQSIENKGDGVVVVKVAVPENANKEKIHSDFNQNYPLALAEIEKYKELLQAKDERIEDHKQQIKDIKQFYSELVNISKSLADQQTSIENKIIQEINNVNNDSSRKIEIGNIGRDFNASGQALNLGEISGTVINTINELATAPEPDKPGIKELLTQLKTAIETDTDLTAKDKEKALKQVKSLAEAAQNPQEKQDLADTAITMLKGTIANLPTAAKLVEECGKLLPLIAGFLGLS
ncbi:pentapeptide repeat-containing protein [Dolichospermum flos-aquae]|uniref:Pentapeptide repeat-containing protein n=1 Tax=Dolichospermum flos-aquae LEGE 04289 TaxID=1828708 RepID=A0ACC5Q5P8_DOLFA|nr:pentapeptide repeat-containing protein [Dolichospermum flos-aquae]MBE9220264.1 pentapeptide repeat-containing protein [Dolichospermum flos-aquae LEGE 04289]